LYTAALQQSQHIFNFTGAERRREFLSERFPHFALNVDQVFGQRFSMPVVQEPSVGEVREALHQKHPNDLRVAEQQGGRL